MNNTQKIIWIDLKPTKNKKLVDCRSLHSSLRLPLFLAQCFGQMPVLGITSPNPKDLRFTWKSLRFLYSAANFGTSLVVCGFCIYCMRDKPNLFDYSNLIFQSCSTAITFFFIILATKWPRITRRWFCVEIAMQRYGWPKYLRTRINCMTVTFLTIAAVETILAKVSHYAKVLQCKPEDETNLEYFLRLQTSKQVFPDTCYSFFRTAFSLTLNVLNTFAWSFNDLFIMLISTALAMRFKQITVHLHHMKKSSTYDINKWQEVREDFNRLCRLTRDVDNALSYIILTSFASNLFFVLMQLFNSLREMREIVEKIYFYVSFGFLLLRTVCVTVYGAWVYDESKKPLYVLQSLPSRCYNVEMSRFLQQLQCDSAALTGKHFFTVTRGLILSIAGAIVTYELVLIQFNARLLQDTIQYGNNKTIIC